MKNKAQYYATPGDLRPPNRLVVYQTSAAQVSLITMPLAAGGVNMKAGVDYILSDNILFLMEKITSETRLLIVGSNNGSITPLLIEFVKKARQLNPQIRVVAYTSFKMPDINPDFTIIKDPMNAVEVITQMVKEVKGVIGNGGFPDNGKARPGPFFGLN
jgi:hypothetical protein